MELALPVWQFYLESKTQVGIPLTSHQQAKIEAIDLLKTKCMRRTDKKCKKLLKGEINFSEETIQPIRQIRWWTIPIKQRLGGKVQPMQ
jgi:hypothetical protein